MTFFSIIIPTYNRANYLSEVINSILKQSFNKFELLIIDDGSTDNTKEIIGSYIKKDSRIKYLHQENSERGAARNKGIKEATGNYLVFFDSDDVMHSNHLEVLYENIIKNKEYFFFSTKYQLKRNNSIYPAPIMQIPTGAYNYQLLLKGNPIGTLFCIQKKNPHLQLFPEDRTLSALEDWLFLLSNLKTNYLYLINSVTVTVNDHDNRSMRNNKDIIQKRITATEWIKKNIVLSKSEIKILDGHSDYFCAVHSYADNQKIKALGFLWQSMLKTSISMNMITLFLKIFLGYNIIQRIK